MNMLKILWAILLSMVTIVIVMIWTNDLLVLQVKPRQVGSCCDNSYHVDQLSLVTSKINEGVDLDISGSVINSSESVHFNKGIFWPEALEKYMPKGLTSNQIDSFFHQVSDGRVTSASRGTESACARTAPDNKLLVMSGRGLKMCARYKRVSIEGEVLTFYLSQLLEIHNVPPVIMKVYNKSDPFWNNLDINSWEEGHVVNLNMWIDGLSGSTVKIPQLLIDLYHSNKTLTSDNPVLHHLPIGEVVHLMQISDILIFGFLQDHTDRFEGNTVKDVIWPSNWNNLYILQTRLQLPPNMHLVNSGEHGTSHKIYLFDNESTFKLSTTNVGSDPVGRKKNYLNNTLMKTVCVFRRKTIDRLKYLFDSEDICEIIGDTVRDEVFMHVGKLMGNCSYFIGDLLKTRIGKVLEWVKYCSDLNS